MNSACADATAGCTLAGALTGAQADATSVAASEFDAARLQSVQAALGLNLGASTQQRLLAHQAMVARWNRVYNLTALRDPAQALAGHLLDCLAALPVLRHWATQRASEARPGAPDADSSDANDSGANDSGTHRLRVLDVGSGAGLPGVVWAIAQPDWQVTCIDSVGKKAAFIRQVAAELALPNVRAVHGRVQQQQGEYDLITSRALAALGDFTAWTAHLLSPAGVWCAMKAHGVDNEQHALTGATVFHVEPTPIPGLDVQRCLVWLRPTQP